MVKEVRNLVCKYEPCSNPFSTTHKKQVFCSNACYIAFYSDHKQYINYKKNQREKEKGKREDAKVVSEQLVRASLLPPPDQRPDTPEWQLADAVFYISQIKDMLTDGRDEVELARLLNLKSFLSLLNLLKILKEKS